MTEFRVAMAIGGLLVAMAGVLIPLLIWLLVVANSLLKKLNKVEVMASDLIRHDGSIKELFKHFEDLLSRISNLEGGHSG